LLRAKALAGIFLVDWRWRPWALLSCWGRHVGAIALLHEISGCKPGPTSGRATAAPAGVVTSLEASSLETPCAHRHGQPAFCDCSGWWWHTHRTACITGVAYLKPRRLRYSWSLRVSSRLRTRLLAAFCGGWGCLALPDAVRDNVVGRHLRHLQPMETWPAADCGGAVQHD
jgi:hypothetical protein